VGIAAKAPRGGLVEKLAGAPRVLVLRNAEIERFEDQHGGIFDLWAGFFQQGARPNSTKVRDLVALALVGGGMADKAADELIATQGPDQNLVLYGIAQAVLGAAFLPDTVDGGGDDPAEAAGAGADPEKKT
jgi:hypothetical protein